MLQKDQSSFTTSAVASLIIVLFVTALYIIYLYFSKSSSEGATHRRADVKKQQRWRPSVDTADMVSYNCSSSECVRCHKYEIVQREAKNRLHKFTAFNGTDGLDRIVVAINDVTSLSENPLQNPNVIYLPGLRGMPWWTGAKCFDREMRLLERYWKEVLDEFFGVYEGIDSKWRCNTSSGGMWTVFSLYNQGVKMEENCHKCPRTTSLLESMSSFLRGNLFSNAMFSVLLPGTTVTEHCGPCNTRIRCHLGLIVPVGASLTVGSERRAWNVGCCQLFDDSFLHSASHAGSERDGPRVVLIVDLWHPDVTLKERHALNDVLSDQIRAL